MKRIIALMDEIYYSMEDGRTIGHLSISYNILAKKLRPYKVENYTKWEPIDKDLIDRMRNLIPHELVEYGIKFNLDNNILWLIYDDQDCFQLSGHFPRYFFKGFIKFIRS